MSQVAFPSIREIAERTDRLPEGDPEELESGADGDIPPIEQVESMCMACGGNVRASDRHSPSLESSVF